jgi:hypothetical protein
MLSDLYPERQRGKIMSWFYVAIPVGSALGFGIGRATAPERVRSKVDPNKKTLSDTYRMDTAVRPANSGANGPAKR